MTFHTPQLLERAKKVLPASSDDLLLRGIMAEATDRIVALKKVDVRLASQFGSIEDLQKKIDA
jgi:hypothetical protein